MGTSTHVDVPESALQNILAILCRLPMNTAVTVAVVALAIPDCGGTGLFAKLLYVPIRQDAHRRIVHGNALGGEHRPEAHQRHNHEAGELEEILPRGHVGCHRLFSAASAIDPVFLFLSDRYDTIINICLSYQAKSQRELGFFRCFQSLKYSTATRVRT